MDVKKWAYFRRFTKIRAKIIKYTSHKATSTQKLTSIKQTGPWPKFIQPPLSFLAIFRSPLIHYACSFSSSWSRHPTTSEEITEYGAKVWFWLSYPFIGYSYAWKRHISGMCFDHVFRQQSREVGEREILVYSIKQGNVIPASLKFYALTKIETLQHRVYHRFQGLELPVLVCSHTS